MAILRPGRENTRVASYGADGLTSDGAFKVPTSEVMDVQPFVEVAGAAPAPVAGIVKERGIIPIPSEVRRRHGLRVGSPFLIEDRGHEIAIRPAAIVPRAANPLDEMLARVSPENLHGEVSTGDAVGLEA